MGGSIGGRWQAIACPVGQLGPGRCGEQLSRRADTRSGPAAARELRRSAGLQGIEGGAEPPLASPDV